MKFEIYEIVPIEIEKDGKTVKTEGLLFKDSYEGKTAGAENHAINIGEVGKSYRILEYHSQIRVTDSVEETEEGRKQKIGLKKITGTSDGN